ncbi:SH3 domain-containing protein [Paracoccus benzoatiresistens]|uniref:SH3 domain-containing protein n=1 Tax=Paracoccus benzoatiresistens TaxID=2997341 RepID=A0ABT4J396_9RHOB|nr:SH3 domain-containing protein [Paracoccus sp. EF6]MCZ0961593.1 SH3 domain-containing protein [Paracoccus sp. EF6]
MLRFALPLIIPALCLGAVTPAAAEPVVRGAEHCVVNVRADDRLNLRAKPGANAAIRERFAYGSCGLIVTAACEGSWCPVEDGHHSGWVHRHYIAALPDAEFCFTAAARRDMRNLRAWPSPESRVVTELPAGQCGISPLPYKVEGWQKARVEGWEGWLPQAGLAHTGD